MPGPARAPEALGSGSGRGRGSSRDAEGASEDEAAPAAASCNVWSGSARQVPPEQPLLPDRDVPFRSRRPQTEPL